MVIMNPNPTNRNLQLPTQEKTAIKLKVKCKKITQTGSEPSPFTWWESTLPAEPLVEMFN